MGNKLDDISFQIGGLSEAIAGLRDDLAQFLTKQEAHDERISALEIDSKVEGGKKSGILLVIGGLCGFISLAATVFSVILPYISR